MGTGGVCAGWTPLLPMAPIKPSTAVSAPGEPCEATEPEVLMIDATDLKAHPTASSLNKGALIPA